MTNLTAAQLRQQNNRDQAGRYRNGTVTTGMPDTSTFADSSGQPVGTYNWFALSDDNEPGVMPEGGVMSPTSESATDPFAGLPDAARSVIIQRALAGDGPYGFESLLEEVAATPGVTAADVAALTQGWLRGELPTIDQPFKVAPGFREALEGRRAAVGWIAPHKAVEREFKTLDAVLDEIRAAGAVLVAIYLLPAVAMIIWFLWGLISSEDAMGMAFPFWLLSLLALAPLWIVGIALLGAGRARQRGPVSGSVIAWILAMGAMPMIGLVLSVTILLLSAGQDSLGGGSFAVLIIGIPVLMVLAVASGAWLIWGRPRAD